MNNSLTDNLSPQTIRFMESEEGCRLHAYQDSRGVYTIGVGMTRLYGRPVKAGDTITQAEADQLFRVEAQSFQSKVLHLVTAPLTQNQTTALVSLAYNIGIGAF